MAHSLPVTISARLNVKRVIIDYTDPEAKVTFECAIPARGHTGGEAVFNAAVVQLPVELSNRLFEAVKPFIQPNPYTGDEDVTV